MQQEIPKTSPAPSFLLCTQISSCACLICHYQNMFDLKGHDKCNIFAVNIVVDDRPQTNIFWLTKFTEYTVNP